MKVSAKKHLGQHFLKNAEICQRIAESMDDNSLPILEIGPGTGALTQELLKRFAQRTSVIEIDEESVMYLQRYFPELQGSIIFGDFLSIDLTSMGWNKFNIIGNFPYNISTQIIFKVIENREDIPQVVGMFQREVAQRICASPGNKTYGILSVLTQAYYHTEYLFTVNEGVFNPPPKVKSGVIRLQRLPQPADCDEGLLRRLVKAGFNQRRKRLGNALKTVLPVGYPDALCLMDLRAEQLSVDMFVALTRDVALHMTESPEIA